MNNKTKYLYALFFLMLYFINIDLANAEITNIDNYNKDTPIGNYDDVTNSYLEGNYRTKSVYSMNHFKLSEENKFYPRIKK